MQKSVVDILRERLDLSEEAERAENLKANELRSLAASVVRLALENDGWDPKSVQLNAERVVLGRHKTTVRVKMTPVGYKWANTADTHYRPEIVVHFKNSNGEFTDGQVFSGSLPRMIERLTNSSYWKYIETKIRVI